MEMMVLILGVAVIAAGAMVITRGALEPSEAHGDVADYLRSLDGEDSDLDEFEQILTAPFLSRVLRPMGSRMLGGVASLAPRNYLDQVHAKLLHAGLIGRLRAEEFVTAQVIGVATGLLLAVGIVVFVQPSPRLGTLALVGGPLIGYLGTQSWLERKVTERKDSIRRELPDVLDLLAISVEAGTGFEGALDIVVRNFTSPLAIEFSRTLKEMELGLSRREALQNLKRRTEVPELSNFVLVLVQADALGMPIGRVLKTQAGEMRLRRRQWARETAAKLPVKILFPLVLFIFPAVLVVVLGPAGINIMNGL